MQTGIINTQKDIRAHYWPELKYENWNRTYETIHRWVQIVGKLKMSRFPCCNHSWHTSLYVSSRGLSTMAIPDGERNFTVEFDFIDHRLIFLTSDRQYTSFKLQQESVSAFYQRFIKALKKIGILASFDLHPNEVLDNTPFDKDVSHRTYNPKEASVAWQVMVRASNVMNIFKSGFIGKSSPVHFFWGSFDLALTRFSGRHAPEHPGGIPHLPDIVVKEAYSEEVSSCGFWPGNDLYPHAAFYSYSYPEPDGFNRAQNIPAPAFYHETLREYVLPYDEVINSKNPDKLVLEFFEATYRAASELGGWDKRALEESVFLDRIKNKNLKFNKTPHQVI